MKACIALGFLLAPGWLGAQQYVISTIAGGAPPPTPGAAITASIGSAYGLATDASGTLYFTSSNCVFKLDKTGVMTRIAGSGRSHYSGDGGPASAAEFSSLSRIAFDAAGNLYVGDGSRVRKISTTGTITTVAGNGDHNTLQNTPPIGSARWKVTPL